jgi:hypothetical protein
MVDVFWLVFALSARLGGVHRASSWPGAMKPICRSMTMCVVRRGLERSNTATPPREDPALSHFVEDSQPMYGFTNR